MAPSPVHSTQEGGHLGGHGLHREAGERRLGWLQRQRGACRTLDPSCEQLLMGVRGGNVSGRKNTSPFGKALLQACSVCTRTSVTQSILKPLFNSEVCKAARTATIATTKVFSLHKTERSV